MYKLMVESPFLRHIFCHFFLDPWRIVADIDIYMVHVCGAVKSRVNTHYIACGHELSSSPW
jgi:hypothetical protein